MNLRRLIPFAFLLLAGTGVANAGIFFGASVGETDLKVDIDDGITFDDKDGAFKAFGGFTFLKFVGIEASYVDFGAPADEVTPGTNVEIDLTGWDVFAKGILPLGNHFDLFAKAGVVYWSADISISGLLNDSDSDDGTDAAYGAGFTIRFAKLFGIRAEYERFDIEDADTADLVSAGFEAKF